MLYSIIMKNYYYYYYAPKFYYIFVSIFSTYKKYYKLTTV